MFTGIVEELAKVEKIKHKANGITITILSEFVINDLKIGDSISVNGVCLTIIKSHNKKISMDIILETLKKSNLGILKEGDYVNLERAMKASDRFNGHIVQGHIETKGEIIAKQNLENEVRLSICLPKQWIPYCIPKGSITLDGVSLTIASIKNNIIDIALIPYTINNTTLGFKKKFDTLNIETDIIGKYISKLLKYRIINK